MGFTKPLSTGPIFTKMMFCLCLGPPHFPVGLGTTLFLGRRGWCGQQDSAVGVGMKTSVFSFGGPGYKM